ncbi:DUF6950 family protein [Pseudoroseicyclus aestuarii]|uniref:DUF6950 domain-containing protein n=1 Tax=Pseudoroseicyclus aestuarii TaxID=1795041 RepID=A0A318SRR5_9RHOB|nr:hypothetical protein [Pseudoroseicyclus aestuarii]PYE80809.1 hypothetical protein DFP88_11119 [Pseudoroseicyclus aestuarii]
MERLTDWRPRLAAMIEDARQRPFAYGRWDCALFAAAAIEAMTGTDLARGFRGYRSRAAGLRAARAKGFEDHVGRFADVLPEIAPVVAGAGDLAVLENTALGIVQGRLIYVPGADGLAMADRATMTRAFRV